MACLLLSLESAYKPARQLALDMMTRLGTATEEMIEIFLAEGKLVSALSLGMYTDIYNSSGHNEAKVTRHNSNENLYQ